MIAAPLTALLKKDPSRLTWNHTAGEAFIQLNTAFTTTPILRHPDPTRPFVVEIAVSESGVGTVLSQYFGEKPKLHPMAFFSRKHSSVKQNYDFGTWDLLAVKLLLEEWRH